MASDAVTWQEIKSRLDDLPHNDWPKVLEFIEFLAFQHTRDRRPPDRVTEQKTAYRITVKLGGLLKDYPIDEEEIAAARKEMWAGFGEMEL